MQGHEKAWKDHVAAEKGIPAREGEGRRGVCRDADLYIYLLVDYSLLCTLFCLF
jgi:hypothetical protein